MLSKAEAMKRARKLDAPKPGVVMTIRPVEVGLAWMELHGLVSARTLNGNPRWEMGVLVLTHSPSFDCGGDHVSAQDGE